MAERINTLRRECTRLNHQLVILNDQYRMWKIRHQRAVSHSQIRFQYVLQLRLTTLEGIMWVIHKVAEHKTTELLVQTSLAEAFSDLQLELVDHLNNI